MFTHTSAKSVEQSTNGTAGVQLLRQWTGGLRHAPFR